MCRLVHLKYWTLPSLTCSVFFFGGFLMVQKLSLASERLSVTPIVLLVGSMPVRTVW